MFAHEVEMRDGGNPYNHTDRWVVLTNPVTRRRLDKSDGDGAADLAEPDDVLVFEVVVLEDDLQNAAMLHHRTR